MAPHTINTTVADRQLGKCGAIFIKTGQNRSFAKYYYKRKH